MCVCVCALFFLGGRGDYQKIINELYFQTVRNLSSHISYKLISMKKYTFYQKTVIHIFHII